MTLRNRSRLFRCFCDSTHQTVAIYVADQQRSLDLYTQKLGFEVRRTESMGPGGKWIELAPLRPGLVIYPRTMMPEWEQLKPSVVFDCNDAIVTCKDLAEKGVQITQEPKRMAWAPSRCLQTPMETNLCWRPGEAGSRE